MTCFRRLAIAILLTSTVSVACAREQIDLVLRLEPGMTTRSRLVIESGRDSGIAPEPKKKPERKPSKRRGKAEEPAPPVTPRDQTAALVEGGTQTTTFIFRSEVASVAADGAAEVRMTVESVSIQADSALNGLFRFDSAKPAESRGLMPGQAERLAALVGRAVSMTVEPRGKVRSMTGADALFEALTAPVEASPTGTALTGVLRSATGADALRSTLAPGLSLMPGEPVRRGESWTSIHQQPLPGMGDVRTEWVSEVARIEKRGASRLATITSKADVAVSNLPAGQGVLPGMVEFLDGKGEAATIFDLTKGHATRSEMMLRLPVRIEALEGIDLAGMDSEQTLTCRMVHEVVEE